MAAFRLIVSLLFPAAAISGPLLLSLLRRLLAGKVIGLGLATLLDAARVATRDTRADMLAPCMVCRGWHSSVWYAGVKRNNSQSWHIGVPQLGARKSLYTLAGGFYRGKVGRIQGLQQHKGGFKHTQNNLQERHALPLVTM